MDEDYRKRYHGVCHLVSLGTLKETEKAIEIVMDVSSWPLDGLQNLDANSNRLFVRLAQRDSIWLVGPLWMPMKE